MTKVVVVVVMVGLLSLVDLVSNFQDYSCLMFHVGIYVHSMTRVKIILRIES